MVWLDLKGKMIKKKTKKIKATLQVVVNGDRVDVVLDGKQSLIERALAEIILENEDFREIIGNSMFLAMSAHLKEHGIDIRDILKQAAQNVREIQQEEKLKKVHKKKGAMVN